MPPKPGLLRDRQPYPQQAALDGPHPASSFLFRFISSFYFPQPSQFLSGWLKCLCAQAHDFLLPNVYLLACGLIG